jgi:hypothetical protein
VYGLEDVLHSIKNHKAETVIVTDKVDINVIEEETSRAGITRDVADEKHPMYGKKKLAEVIYGASFVVRQHIDIWTKLVS